MVDLSDAIVEAYEHAPADVTYFDTLEITHQSFLETIKVVQSGAKLTTNQGEFLPVNFSFALPETEGSVRGEMTIKVNFLPKEARVKIREAALTRYKISVIYRQYIGSSLDPDAELPNPLQVSTVKETPTGIEVNAMFPDLIGAYFPRRLMTVSELPGCRV